MSKAANFFTVLSILFSIPVFATGPYPPKDMDQIKIFLEERIDGKKTGNFLFLNISVFKNEGKIGWSTSRVLFHKYYSGDPFDVISEESTSVWTFSTPHLSKIEWMPGNSFKAKYDITHDCGENLLLIAKRVGSKERDAWDVQMSGLFCEIDIEASKKKKWEFFTVDEVKIEKSVFKTQNRFKTHPND